MTASAAEVPDEGLASPDNLGDRPGWVAPPSPPLPSVEGRFVTLVPVSEAHVPYLYHLATTPALAFRWRYRGMSPAPEQFVRDLWRGVLTQFVIQHRRTLQPAGVVSAFTADLRNGFAHLAIVTGQQYARKVIGIEAAALFLDYLFDHFPLRKLYAEAPGWNVQQFASGANRIFHEEGRLREHEFYAGRYWDLHVFAVYRTDWEARTMRRRQRDRPALL
ncbi:MAG: GNAT family N-acetyltransferase [Acidimicrobiales bacterium]